jgi:hypothetical protein
MVNGVLRVAAIAVAKRARARGFREQDLRSQILL